MPFMSNENFIEYLYQKRSEIKNLRFRDLLLAKAVTDIHRYSVKQQVKVVPLWAIEPIHCIDRDSALKKLNERVAILNNHRHEILKDKILDQRTLQDILPSVFGIKVIYGEGGGFISFEGNGRLEAFKKVFHPKDNIMIEVEVYRLKARNKVLRRVNRVLKRNF